MAFNLFFAGCKKTEDEILYKNKAPRLYSYLNDRKEIDEYAKRPERGLLLVDSGAFSVAHSGKTVNIDEYISYINSHPEIEYFIELDEIPYPVLNVQTAKESAEGSWRNYLYMIERLDDPYKLLPVYHFGEDIKYLQQMLEFTYKGKHIPYICIGGRHGVSTLEQEKYFDRIFNIIKHSSNPDVKIHVLGMTVLNSLTKFPFFSADSTTYVKQGAYGLLFSSWGPINIGDRNYKFTNFKYMPDEAKQRLLDEVHSFGYDMDALCKDTLLRTKYNIEFTLKWMKEYQYTPSSTLTNTLF